MGSFSQQCAALLQELGQSKKMVLATSCHDRVTARMMSIIILDGIFYFQTDRRFAKYEQLQRNKNAALCMDNLQIEGCCRELGHPSEEPTFCRLYEQFFPNSYQRYTHLAHERLFAFEPTYIKRWIYEAGEPYEEIFDFTHRTYEKRKYI